MNTILDHIQLWTTAQTPKTSGRGNRADNQQLLGIQKLREMILELAVRGKLLPQDPNDKPASTLLQQIKFVNKSSLISDDELPFDLPNGWSWCRLGDIGYTNIGLTYSPKDISDDGIPVLRSSNIQNGEICLDDLVRVNTTVNEKVLVEKGDLLICARNGSRNLVGKCALIKDLTEKTAFGAFMAIFRSNFNNYIKFFIESPIYRRSLEGVTTTTINQITQGNLKATVIALPPLAEQHRIVAKVDELMALCDQLEQQQTENNQLHQTLVETLLANLTQATSPAEQEEAWQRISAHFDDLFTTEYSIDQLKQTILQLAVMGKLVPQNPADEPASELLKKIAKEKARMVKEGKIKKQAPLPEITDDEKPFELPEGWEWVRLGSFSEIKGGKRLPNGHSFSMTETPYIYIQVTNMKNGTILCENLKYVSKETQSEISRYTISKNDLYITIAGTIGDVGIVPEYFDGMQLTENAAKIVFQEINKTWLQKTLSSKILQDQFIEKTKQLAQPKLALHRIESSCIPLPPLAEQHRIVAKVDELFALCDALKELLVQAQTTQNLLAGAVVTQALAKKLEGKKYSPKQLENFHQKQIIGMVLKKHHEKKMLNGEMVLAKNLFLLDKIYGVKTHFNFVKWHFGTYDPKIRVLINGNDKYFKKIKIGNYDTEVLDLGENAENLFRPEYHTPELDQVEKGMDELLDIYSKFPLKDRSKKIELLNTVCKIISDIRKSDIASIRKAMEEWETPKSNNRTKAERFTVEETKECISLILGKGWDKKLITSHD